MAELTEYIRICHVNCQSLLAHLDEFRSFFESSGYHIICECLSETWLKPSISDHGFSSWISYYKVGGVALYLCNQLKVRILQYSEERYCCKPEYLMAEISINVSSNLLLSVVYRPPHCRYLSEVFNIFADISALYKHSIIFGDFNADLDSHSYDAQLIKSFVSSMHFTLVPQVDR